MPDQLSYPGVYIQELPSGVHTITGVPTSIVAFVGPTLSGAPDMARTVTSFADFERYYGGLWDGSALSYAVQQFYANGGQVAVIVRLLHELGDDGKPLPAGGPISAKIELQSGPTLSAKYPGSWGNNIRARIDYATRDRSNDKLYNLTVFDPVSGLQEQYPNIEADAASTRALDRVLQASALVAVDLGDPPNRDTLGHRPESNADVPFGQNPWTDGAGLLNYKSDQNGSDGQSADGKPVPLSVPDYAAPDGPTKKTGIYALLDDNVFFNMLCLPSFGEIDPGVWAQAAVLCRMKRAMLLVDPPMGWSDENSAETGFLRGRFNALGDDRKNAALYFPRVVAAGPDGPQTEFAPCGVVAGIYARTDAARGVWKAPAGLDASLNGVTDLAVSLNNLENGRLNVLGVNCLRSFPIIGNVVWGARTLMGADALANEWKYVPVRRLALFIEESLYRGSQWIVFEPNDEPLWAQIRLNFGAFMHDLFRQGAFQGTTPKDAYFVKCDSETTIQNDIDQGIVNIIVGFAPLKPAEFVVIKIQQMAGQIAV
jgi:phage tail sheath protein FI